MNRSTYLIGFFFVFIGLPLAVWSLGDIPHRTLLKDADSVATLLAFCLLLGQFVMSRLGPDSKRSLGLRTTVRTHKVVGYTAVAVLLVHPLLVVLPRTFESGITAQQAFVTMITTLDSPGVVLGLVAWGLMLVLGLTSMVRGQLPLSYRTWRLLHGVLSVLFVVVAVWHAIDLGRHMGVALSAVIIMLAAGGVGLFFSQLYQDHSEVRHD